MSAHANHCFDVYSTTFNGNKPDRLEWGITVHNDTGKLLHIDLGDPTHGEVDTNRYVYIRPHATARTVACSHGAGLETYVRLLDEKHRYLAQWYVYMPYMGKNRVQYWAGSCEVKYASGEVYIDYPKVVRDFSSLKPESAHIYNHDWVIETDVRCH